MQIQFTVSDVYRGKTIADYFKEQRYSTAFVKRLKYSDNGITVNGQRKTVRYVLEKGDVVCLTAPQKYTAPQQSANKAELLWSDRYLYVALKPCKQAVHPDRKHQNDTLGNDLAACFGGGFVLRIATRLDKETSGLVLGAKDEVTAERLNSMQQEHLIKKTYYALVCGKPENFLLREQKPLRCVLKYQTTLSCFR